MPWYKVHTLTMTLSSRMWINESVFSAAYTYKWGIALPIWWASGLSFQIALMAMLGIVAKLRVPYAHTSLEIIKLRYGKYAHWIFIVLNLINNIFGCGSMILAGAQLVTGMTGMHVVAACILIPAGGKSVDKVSPLQALIFSIHSRYLHSCGRAQGHFLDGFRPHHCGSDPLDLLLSRSLDE
jgi:urea-proton symporter